MPQLIPSPWLAYLLFSWVVFSTVVLPKVSMHVFPENPLFRAKQKPQTESWNWPWY